MTSSSLLKKQGGLGSVVWTFKAQRSPLILSRTQEYPFGLPNENRFVLNVFPMVWNCPSLKLVCLGCASLSLLFVISIAPHVTDGHNEHNFGLWLAASRGDVAAVKHALHDSRLIRAAADHYRYEAVDAHHGDEYVIDWHDHHHDEQTAVHAAARNGHLGVVKVLLEHKPKGWSAEAKTKYQDSPLHFAARYGHYDIAEYLVHVHKVRTHLKGKNKQTPLWWAQQAPESYFTTAQKEGKQKIVGLLEEKGSKRRKLEL
jgi:hypothetical protein